MVFYGLHDNIGMRDFSTNIISMFCMNSNENICTN